MTGVAKKTVMRLLVEAGAVASKYQDEAFRNLTCRRIQVDELWTFIGAKAKNVTPEITAKNPNAGDIWLWVALDADTKWFRAGCSEAAMQVLYHSFYMIFAYASRIACS